MLNDNLLINEEYKIFDRLAHQLDRGKRGPLGWVQIFLETKKGLVFDEGPNLVSAQGREFVAQRVFNSSTPSANNWTAYTISHFAVGSGGSTVSAPPPVVTLNGPYICDTHLITPTSLGTAGYLTEGATTLAVKPITASSGSLALESVTYSGGSGSCSYYTKMKCTCIIPGPVSGEPTSLAPGATTKIDEAALYFTNGGVGTPLLFSHICFAPKWKEKESTLTIQWYILF